ncbi:MAG TPA: DUF167 domain-containing protein [Actinomycetota bacterium]
MSDEQTERTIGDLIEETARGPVLRIRVTPRAKRAGVRMAAGRLAVGVRAPAEAGKATEEALRRVAELLGLPRSAVRLASGATSRDKRILVPGHTPFDLRKRIAEGLGTLL